jgi:hypothetical protein
MNRKTSPPAPNEQPQSARPRSGEADLLETIRDLRERDYDDDDDVVAPEIVNMSVMSIPDVIARVLASDDRGELLEVARLLDAAQQSERSIIFYTPIGAVKCRINWRSASPEDLRKTEGLMFVKLRSSSVTFVPDAGAVFDVGFEDYDGRIRVMCMAQQQLYPGVDLLCFMLHTRAMEKQGVLRDGAPSVVSGKPSAAVDNDEPVAENEKAASVHEAAGALARRECEDFDKIRE